MRTAASLYVFAREGAGQVAADNGHVDRVALQICTHDDALVEGRQIDGSIGMRFGKTVDDAVIAISRSPLAAGTAGATGSAPGVAAIAAIAAVATPGKSAKGIAAGAVTGPCAAEALTACAGTTVGIANRGSATGRRATITAVATQAGSYADTGSDAEAKACTKAAISRST
jgi:hypothetical protein